MTDRSHFSIVPIGSLHTGWALKVDGIILRSSPSLISLGAYVDAIMAGASEAYGLLLSAFISVLEIGVRACSSSKTMSSATRATNRADRQRQITGKSVP